MNAPADAFVPLVPGSSGKPKSEEFRVLVAPNPEKARSLGVQLQAQAAAFQAARAPCKPRVVLHRDGDRVTSIVVHCSCGEIIDLNCAYSDTGSGISSGGTA